MTVVDRSDKHLCKLGSLFLPFCKNAKSQIIRQARESLPRGVGFVQAKVDQYTPKSHAITLKNGPDKLCT